MAGPDNAGPPYWGATANGPANSSSGGGYLKPSEEIKEFTARPGEGGAESIKQIRPRILSQHPEQISALADEWQNAANLLESIREEVLAQTNVLDSEAWKSSEAKLAFLKTGPGAIIAFLDEWRTDVLKNRNALRLLVPVVIDSHTRMNNLWAEYTQAIETAMTADVTNRIDPVQLAMSRTYGRGAEHGPLIDRAQLDRAARAQWIQEIKDKYDKLAQELAHQVAFMTLDTARMLKTGFGPEYKAPDAVLNVPHPPFPKLNAPPVPAPPPALPPTAPTPPGVASPPPAAAPPPATAPPTPTVPTELVPPQLLAPPALASPAVTAPPALAAPLVTAPAVPTTPGLPGELGATPTGTVLPVPALGGIPLGGVPLAGLAAAAGGSALSPAVPTLPGQAGSPLLPPPPPGNSRGRQRRGENVLRAPAADGLSPGGPSDPSGQLAPNVPPGGLPPPLTPQLRRPAGAKISGPNGVSPGSPIPPAPTSRQPRAGSPTSALGPSSPFTQPFPQSPRSTAPPVLSGQRPQRRDADPPPPLGRPLRSDLAASLSPDGSIPGPPVLSAPSRSAPTTNPTFPPGNRARRRGLQPGPGATPLDAQWVGTDAATSGASVPVLGQPQVVSAGASRLDEIPPALRPPAPSSPDRRRDERRRKLARFGATKRRAEARDENEEIVVPSLIRDDEPWRVSAPGDGVLTSPTEVSDAKPMRLRPS